MYLLGFSVHIQVKDEQWPFLVYRFSDSKRISEICVYLFKRWIM